MLWVCRIGVVDRTTYFWYFILSKKYFLVSFLLIDCGQTSKFFWASIYSVDKFKCSTGLHVSRILNSLGSFIPIFILIPYISCREKFRLLIIQMGA